METSYIEQLQQTLQTQFIIPQNELESIIDNYRLTVQTIIDETGNEEAVFEQLGDPSILAQEIAQEFHFANKTIHPNTESEPLHDSIFQQMIKKNLNWPLIIIVSVIAILFGFPFIISIFSVLVSFILIFGSLLISSVVLAPSLFSSSPWFIIALFFAGASSITLFILLTIALIRGLIFLIKKVLNIPLSEKRHRRTPLTLIIMLIITAIIANTAVFSLPFTDSNLRSKIPYNMFQFSNRFTTGEKQTTTKDFPQADVKQIDITASGVEIKTVESQDNSYHITIKSSQNHFDDMIRLEGGILTLSTNIDTNCFFCIDFSDHSSSIELAIPKNAQLESFAADISGGAVSLHAIHTKDAKLEITGGSFDVKELISTNANFRVTGGEIITQSAIIQSTIDVDITGGSAHFKTLQADTGNFKITGGEINIDSPQIKKVNKHVTAGSLNI